MTSWELYIDDSRDRGFFVLAGYMAPSGSWSKLFVPAWRSVLNNGDQPIPEFKASDCRHGVRSFKGWNQEDRIDLTKRLVAVIIEPRSQLFGVSCGVLTPRIADRKLRYSFENLSYTICLTTFIAESFKIVSQSDKLNNLNIYLDEQAKVAHLVPMAFDNSINLYASVFKGKLRKPEFRKSVETLPLQAADLLAYETLKEIRNRRARPQRPFSKALKVLTHNRPHLGRFLNLDAAVPDLGEPRGRLPGVDSTKLGIIYDCNGVEHNRGRLLERLLK